MFTAHFVIALLLGSVCGFVGFMQIGEPKFSQPRWILASLMNPVITLGAVAMASLVSNPFGEYRLMVIEVTAAISGLTVPIYSLIFGQSPSELSPPSPPQEPPTAVIQRKRKRNRRRRPPTGLGGTYFLNYDLAPPLGRGLSFSVYSASLSATNQRL